MFVEFQEIRDDELIDVAFRPENIVGVEADKDQARLWLSYPEAYLDVLVNESYSTVIERLRAVQS